MTVDKGPKAKEAKIRAEDVTEFPTRTKHMTVKGTGPHNPSKLENLETTISETAKEDTNA